MAKKRLLYTVTETVVSTINMVVEYQGHETMDELQEAAEEAAVDTSGGWLTGSCEVHAQLTDKLPEDYDGPVDVVTPAKG